MRSRRNGGGIAAPPAMWPRCRSPCVRCSLWSSRRCCSPAGRAPGAPGPALTRLIGLDLALRSDSTATGPVSGGTVRLQVVRIDADRILMTLSDAAGVVLIGPLEARRAPAQPLLSEPGC